MKLDRRWWFAIGVVVVAVVAFALSQYGVFGPSSEECRPVKEMLEFNASQAEQIAAKTGDSEGIPTVAEEGAYQAWADGLAERARACTMPDLATRATQLASLVQRVRRQVRRVLRAQSQSRAPGAPAPPAAYRDGGVEQPDHRDTREAL